MPNAIVRPATRVFRALFVAMHAAARFAHAQAPDAVARPTDSLVIVTHVDTLRPRVGATYLALGGVGLRVAALNGALRSNGLPALGAGAVTVGAGTYVTFGRLVLGADGQAVQARPVERDGWRSRAGGGYGLLQGGLVVAHDGRRTLAVLVGGGASTVNTSLRRTDRRSFDEFVHDARIGGDLRGHGALLSAGLLGDVAIRRRRAGRASTMLGVQAGYTWHAGRPVWRTDGDRLAGGPVAGVGGAYLRLSLGTPVSRRRDAALPSVVTLLPFVLR